MVMVEAIGWRGRSISVGCEEVLERRETTQVRTCHMMNDTRCCGTTSMHDIRI
jgi:hypothetical protein